MTPFTFTFTLENALPTSAQIEVRYPTQIDLDTSYLACVVSLGGTVTCTADTKSRKILASSVNTYPIAQGTNYTLTVYGLINSKYAAATDSFYIQTMTSAGNQINY